MQEIASEAQPGNVYEVFIMTGAFFETQQGNKDDCEKAGRSEVNQLAIVTLNK